MNEERQQQLREGFSRSGMMQLLGAQLQVIGNGFCEIIVPRQDFMARPAGMFNGAVIASLVDVSSGYAAASAKPVDSYFTTVELKVNYLNPAIGESLIARASVIKNGKVISVVRADIYASGPEGETHAATSLVTMMQLSGKKSPQPKSATEDLTAEA